MTKPVMNLDEAPFDDVEDNGRYTSRRAQISDLIGARKLGYNHEEEMFFILEGEGELRFGDERFTLRVNDVIACPAGGPEVAHQIINTGKAPMRYLAISTVAEVDAAEYPDSQKVLVYAGPRGKRRLRKMFRAEDGSRDYYDREPTANFDDGE
jgi:uncharacterized cupin superfamily protein